MLIFRTETIYDHQTVYDINCCAFGQENEARLVCAIRNADNYISRLSVVAIKDQQLVGHILLSPLTIESSQGLVDALSLAPLAVRPAYQRQGIGSQLIQKGLNIAREMGHQIVIVVGHPNFYTKFGFAPARAKGFECPFPVPDEAFMVCELQQNALNGVSGMVCYPAAFNEV